MLWRLTYVNYQSPQLDHVHSHTHTLDVPDDRSSGNALSRQRYQGDPPMWVMLVTSAAHDVSSSNNSTRNPSPIVIHLGKNRPHERLHHRFIPSSHNHSAAGTTCHPQSACIPDMDRCFRQGLWSSPWSRQKANRATPAQKPTSHPPSTA